MRHLIAFLVLVTLCGCGKSAPAKSRQEAHEITAYVLVPIIQIMGVESPAWTECVLSDRRSAFGAEQDRVLRLPDGHRWMMPSATRIGAIQSSDLPVHFGLDKGMGYFVHKSLQDFMLDAVAPNGCRWQCDPKTESRCRD